jgi:hypothetical protein
MSPLPEPPTGTDTGCRPRWALNTARPDAGSAIEAIRRLRSDGPDPADGPPDTEPSASGRDTSGPDTFWRRLFN